MVQESINELCNFSLPAWVKGGTAVAWPAPGSPMFSRSPIKGRVPQLVQFAGAALRTCHRKQIVGTHYSGRVGMVFPIRKFSGVANRNGNNPSELAGADLIDGQDIVVEMVPALGHPEKYSVPLQKSCCSIFRTFQYSKRIIPIEKR